MNNHTLFCISGHSGSGKTSLMRRVCNDDMCIVSTTTRPKRIGEIEGLDYYYINNKEFDKLKDSNKLAEETNYYNSVNKYAITKEEIDKKLEKGDAYVIVDLNGMMQLKEYYDNIVSVFLYTDKHVARERMIKRGDNSLDIGVRLDTYEKEMLTSNCYDYVIKNVIFGNTASIIDNIMLQSSNVIKLDNDSLNSFESVCEFHNAMNNAKMD